MTHCNALQLQHNATHCDILQHTETCCNTLQHPATPCNTLHYTSIHSTATDCNTLQHTATHREEPQPLGESICHFLKTHSRTTAREGSISVLQCVAVCCSLLKCVAVCCNVLQWKSIYERLQGREWWAKKGGQGGVRGSGSHTASHCNILQHTATPCNTHFQKNSFTNVCEGGDRGYTRECMEGMRVYMCMCVFVLTDICVNKQTDRQIDRNTDR